jgi:riboflavin kinase/FMN adenylyltransferase
MVEVHFFDFSGDLYGTDITVQIVERLRDERKFNGVNELLMQLKSDRVKAEYALREVLL